MGSNRPIVWALAAALIMAAAATASARDRGLAHPPIHVATPTGRSPITPYFFSYGSRYRYNSPGPVYSQLDYWGPGDSCRVWRYNYLYWAC
jgi:hypothetical protein